MKKKLPLLFFCFFSVLSSFAQNDIGGLFLPPKKQTLDNISKVTSEAVNKLNKKAILLLDIEKSKKMSKKKDAYTIKIPSPDGGELEIELEPVNFLDNNFTISTPKGKQTVKMPSYYRGKIKGHKKTHVLLSILEGEVSGLVSSETFNYTIGKISDTEPLHIIYPSEETAIKKAFENDFDIDSMGIRQKVNIKKASDMDKKSLDLKSEVQACSSDAVLRVYFEADYALYQQMGSSVSATAIHIANIFNQVALLYANASIHISLSEVKVWDEKDPYIAGDTGSMMNLFNAHWDERGNTYNGDLKHLLSGQPYNNGLAGYYITTPVYENMTERASFYGCGKSFSGVSTSISSTVQNIPTYSWNVEVIAHEIGHNCGLPHTHNCNWPGGAIDGCTTLEGSCTMPSPQYPEGGGTIMSYCHQQSVGINFTKGFGSMPTAKLVAEFNAATCLGRYSVTAPTSDTSSSYCSSAAITLTTSCSSGVVQWYKDPSGGTALATGNSFTTPVLSKSTIYFATCKETSSCESSRIPMYASIYLLTDVVVGNSQNNCGSGRFTLSATGCNHAYQWFDSETSTTVLATGATFTTPILQQNTTYYVNCTNGTCSIPKRIPVSATIEIPASLISPTDTLTTSQGNIALNLGLTYKNTELRTSKKLISPASEAIARPITDHTSANKGCNQNTAWPMNSNLMRFQVSQSGSYTMTPNKGIITIFSNSPYNCTTMLASSAFGAGTGSVSWYGNITQNLSPNVTYHAIIYDANNNGGEATLSFNGSGEIFQVLDPPSGMEHVYVAIDSANSKIKLVSQNADFTNLLPGTYNIYGLWVTTGYNTALLLEKTVEEVLSLSGCFRFSNNHKVIIIKCSSTPPAPTVPTVSRCGAGTVTLTASGCSGTYSWFANNTTATTIATGVSYTTPAINTSTTYYIECAVGSCKSTRTAVTANVNPTPAAPNLTANPTTVSSGETSTLSATGCAGSVNWYNVASGGTSAATGSTFTTPNLSTSTTYYSDCSLSGCTSSRNSVNVSVKAGDCPPVLTYGKIVQATGVYKAGEFINSQANVSTNTKYQAGKAILLTEGFEAGSSEVFEATIQGCQETSSK